jgi:hypothetical protein
VAKGASVQLKGWMGATVKKRRAAGAAAGVMFLAIGGCVTTEQNIVLSTTFDPKEAAFIHKTGTGRIDGQAFMRQVGGQVVTAAGESVVLLPSVSYTDEIVAAAKAAEARGPYAPKPKLEADPALKEYAKVTQADATGNFSFDRLGPGEYYLYTTVKWGVPTRHGINNQGGELVERVSLGKGEQRRVIMTR